MAEQSRIDIIGSILNFDPKDAAAWPASRIRSATEAVGYIGIAFTPLRSALYAQILAGLANEDVNALIGTIHQPYREETAFNIIRKAFKKLPDRKGAVLELASLGMPRLDQGDAAAARIQRRLKRPVPYMVHPYGQLFGDSLRDPSHAPNPRRDYQELREMGIFADLEWQLTAELAANRGTLSKKDPIKTVQDTVAVMRGEGLGKVAFDTNHAQAERQGHRLPKPEEMVGWLATEGELGIFEYSVQPRLGGDIDDLDQTLAGNIDRTPHGEMLAAAAGNTPPDETFHLKVEVPAYAFGDMGMHYQRGHELLVPILRNYTNEHLQTA